MLHQYNLLQKYLNYATVTALISRFSINSNAYSEQRNTVCMTISINTVILKVSYAQEKVNFRDVGAQCKIYKR